MPERPELIVIQEIWLNFRQLLSSFHQLMSMTELPAKLQTTTMYLEIATFVDSQLLPLGEKELPTPIASKMRSYTTEVHRLVKLLHRDLLFWQSARQTPIQEQRRLEILAKLEVITRFAQSMIDELTLSIVL